MSTSVASDEVKRVANRLRRAQGQLAAVVAMVEEGRDCRDVVIQLSAVSAAIDRAGFAIIASAMRDCMRDDVTALSGGADDPGAERLADLEKLFLSLA